MFRTARVGPPDVGLLVLLVANLVSVAGYFKSCTREPVGKAVSFIITLDLHSHSLDASIYCARDTTVVNICSNLRVTPVTAATCVHTVIN